MIAKRILLIFLFVLLSGCSFEPENTHDMLLYVNKNYAVSPEKALAVYKKFDKEGEEALIRVFFNIAPQGEAYYDAEVKKSFDAGNVPVRKMMTALSEDQAFLRAILEVSRKHRQSTADIFTGEYMWVLRHNKALFQTWATKEIALNDTRLADVWKTYFTALPEEALADSFTLMQRYTAEIGPYAHTWPWLAEELTAYKKQNRKATLTPEQFRFVFVSGLSDNLFKEWRLSTREWMRRHPEDFGLGLWLDKPVSIGGGTILPSSIPEKEFPRSAVKPTASGDKVMLFYDRSNSKYGLPKYGLDELISIDTARMRSLLPKNVTAESLVSYDKQIVLALTPLEVATYTMMRPSGNNLVAASSERIQGVRWKLTVTYSGLATGKVLAKKEFLGSPPPESKQTSGKVSFIAGDVPWHDANDYIKGLFPNQAAPKKLGILGM